jgi:hypothetical protein
MVRKTPFKNALERVFCDLFAGAASFMTGLDPAI